jgi:hypothetical protein
MRAALSVLALIVLVAGIATAQAPTPAFDDVPPWHWAFQAIQELAQKGMLLGYPKADRELALNGVAQVFDSFAHARHPEARAWAERFLFNLPPNWPQPLDRSSLLSFHFAETQVRLAGLQGTVTISLGARVRIAGPPFARIVQTRFSLRVAKDGTGRWRVDYASLAAAQPEIFR